MVPADISDPTALDCREIEAPTIEIDFEGFSVRLNPDTYMRKLPLRPGISVSSPNGVSLQNIDNGTSSEQRHTVPQPPTAADTPTTHTTETQSANESSHAVKQQELVSLLQKNVEVSKRTHKTSTKPEQELEQREC